MLSCIGNLYTMIVTNADKDETVKSVCPTCTSPTEFLGQRLICKQDKDHGPFERADVLWGQLDGDKKIVKVDKAKIDAARASQRPEKEMELRVHRRDDVRAATFPSGNSYVFRPEGSSKLYGILVDVLKERPDLCLVSCTNIRNKDHVVMVDLALNDQLVVRDMIWPEDMTEQPTIEYDYPANMKAQATMLLDASVEDFVLADYKKEARERVVATIEEARGVPATSKKPSAKKAVKSDDDSLAQALEAAIASAKKKPAAKRAS